MNNTHLQQYLLQCLDLIYREQADNGGFPNVYFFNNILQQHERHTTTFYTSCIMLALQGVAHKQAEVIRNRGARLLHEHHSEHWSYNYWLRNASETRTHPYPDDLDDTSLALAALTTHQPDSITGAVLAQVVLLLTSAEAEEGGPYYTWLVPPETDSVWKDVDVAVNSNIGYFLSLHQISLPCINALIKDTIAQHRFTSRYYASWEPIVYFISRIYRGAQQNQLLRYLENKAPNSTDTPLSLALRTTALCNLNAPLPLIEKHAYELLKYDWKTLARPYPLVAEHATATGQPFSGAASITAALVVEALTAYQQKLTAAVVTPLADEHGLALYQQIITQAEYQFSQLPEALRTTALAALKETLANDASKQIGLISYYFYSSLKPEYQQRIDYDILVHLGLVNVYGWLAYTIYDDFLDNEGDSPLLSSANSALRELTVLYMTRVSRNQDTAALFQMIMNTIDDANTWETRHCRVPLQQNRLELKTIPDYGDLSRLAERSIGHALGPLTIVSLCGYDTHSPELHNLLAFFKHYIIARQLNDDLHDWEQDIQRGQITSVVALLLQHRQQQNTSEQTTINVTTDLPQLREPFWYHVAPVGAKQMQEHLNHARQAVQRVSLLARTDLFEKLLAPIEKSACTVLKDQKEMVEFLQSYTS